MKKNAIKSALVLEIVMIGVLAGVALLKYGSVSSSSWIYIGIISSIALLGHLIIALPHPSYARSIAAFMCLVQLSLFVPVFATMGEPSLLDGKEWIHSIKTIGVVSVLLTMTIMVALRTQWVKNK